METTALYVEYIVIGMETLVWILMSVFIIVGNSFKQVINYCISNMLPSIMMVIICYILGLVTDRICDQIFEKRKEKIKNDFELKSQTSIVIWEEYSNSTYANFTLSRIRILRSTIFNSMMTCILGTYLAFLYIGLNLSYFIFIIFICIFLGSNHAHKKLLENYYQKTLALENEKISKNKKIVY